MSDHTDDRLDLLLSAWAAPQRLDDREADRILEVVLAEPRSTLPAAWWQDLSAQVSAAVVRANTRVGVPGGGYRAGVAIA